MPIPMLMTGSRYTLKSMGLSVGIQLALFSTKGTPKTMCHGSSWMAAAATR
jgi:hypothetical protein